LGFYCRIRESKSRLFEIVRVDVDVTVGIQKKFDIIG